MKVLSLVDNRSLPGRNDLQTEPGLSMLIQSGDWLILFDTGVAGAFQANARRLGVDLAQISLAVLSHHHFDHGGGLAAFFQTNPEAPLYLRRGPAGEPYLHLFGLFKRYIGLDTSLFARYADRFSFIDESTEIAPEVHLLTQIGRRHSQPRGNRHLLVHTEGAARPDDFAHELILVVRENEALVVFSGCSHNGILNILEAVMERFPGQPIRAVFGGFHLIDLPVLNTMAGGKAEVAALGCSLLTYPIDKMYTGHCTGLKAYKVLKEVMGERLEYFATGDQVVI